MIFKIINKKITYSTDVYTIFYTLFLKIYFNMYTYRDI